MQFAATIAVVLSVLVLAFQARQLAAQSRVANEVAGTEAHREILFHWDSVIAPVFIQYPELSAYYYDETTTAPSAMERIRLNVIATQDADFLEIGLTTSRQLGSYAHDIGDWPDYISQGWPARRHFGRSSVTAPASGQRSTRSSRATTLRVQLCQRDRTWPPQTREVPGGIVRIVHQAPQLDPDRRRVVRTPLAGRAAPGAPRSPVRSAARPPVHEPVPCRTRGERSTVGPHENEDPPSRFDLRQT